MSTKLTRSFDIEIRTTGKGSKILESNIESKKILHLIKNEKTHYKGKFKFKIYLFRDSYIMYIEEFDDVNYRNKSVIIIFNIFIFSYYHGCKDIKTFEFKENMLIL